MKNQHDRELAEAFDGQAARFERAPVQSDPEAIWRLVVTANLRPGSLVLDAGCGPGLISSALLDAGHRVVGVDLSREMIERARMRCAVHGERARFIQTSVLDPVIDQLGPFDAALSRYVLHHVENPRSFLQRQLSLLRPEGILVVSDHVTDPEPNASSHHERLEKARDLTHTRNLSEGELVDLFASLGLNSLSLSEETFVLDFDEWFDRGTPADTKENVRRALLEGPSIRGFRASLQPDGSIKIAGIRVTVRGLKGPSGPG